MSVNSNVKVVFVFLKISDVTVIMIAMSTRKIMISVMRSIAIVSASFTHQFLINRELLIHNMSKKTIL